MVRPIGLGLTENFALPEQDVFVHEAVKLGYQSLWTNESAARDSFLVCQRWSMLEPSLVTGVAVIPVLLRSPQALAMSAATLAETTGGKYVLGLGTGSIERVHQQTGTPNYPAIGLMRDYVNIIREFHSGQPVNYIGKALQVRGGQFGMRPLPTPAPIYLAALGPQMLRLCGEVADGVLLNFASAERVAWARERVAEGAAKTKRDPTKVVLSGFVRICIDDDPEVGRITLTKHLLGYALSPAYRAHFERMGMKAAIDAAMPRLARGDSPDAVAKEFPGDLVLRCCYYGKADGAAAAMKALSVDLDLPIVRIIPARPGPASIRAVMESCQPSAWEK